MNTLSGSNYLCLQRISMVPKMFEPLRFDCIQYYQVDGKCGPGRPKMTWKQLREGDCREWKLFAVDPHDRYTWRSDARSAMHAAS